MKLKGFSFIEIVASIIISGIVIGSAYSAYIYCHKQLSKFNASKKEVRNYFELSALLNQEIETSKKIIKKGDRSIALLFDGGKTIEYTFDTKNISRLRNNVSEVFPFSVNAVEMKTQSSSNLAIDYLKLELGGGDRQKYLSYYKTYGAIDKIKN